MNSVLKYSMMGVGAVVALYLVYYMFIKEGFNGGTKTMILYYLPKCGFCEQMMDEWNAVENKYKGSTDVKVKKIDCSQQPEVAEENGISGFPTVILFNGGERKVFDDERTAEKLEGFLQS